MSPSTIAMLSFSMSADAFAASMAKGASLDRPRLSEALRTGAIFGTVEAITPLLGWAVGLAASAYIAAVDHWIAFVLLAVIGGRMVRGALKPPESLEGDGTRPRRHSLGVLLATAIATSLDAMIVGVSLAFLDVNILVIALCIGGATFLLSTGGVLFGRHLGARLGRWAEGLGGLGLMAIGTSILIEHLFLA
nr:manganese efflux pump MntP family protein [uncultured Roseococcus sp.]